MRRILIIALTILSSSVLWAQDDSFSISHVPDSILARMKGHSLPKDAAVDISELRFVRIMHVDENGKSHHGQLVCNRAIADDLLYIFKELYRIHYPIHSVRLVDEYGASDEVSMEANNTSCFNYRLTTRGALSKHARGMAIDINPLWNPCIHTSGKHKGLIEPKTAKRTHIINTSDKCYKLFKNRGFKWGGAWKGLKDYQHFEK